MSLRSLLVRIRGDRSQLDSTLRGAEGPLNRFTDIIKKVGAAIGLAFGVRAIINFAKEAVKAAAAAEGIKKGFEQIATPGLLDELRKATKGTVSDLQLMSRAVQASNFQIPLKDLAKLLEFASARAVQTGQSVEYLVDSIVLGIGRKSPLILDNLGISAVKLREKLKGVGTEVASVGDIAEVVGDIATEELAKMGGMAETAAVKLQQVKTVWNEIKEGVGKVILESKLYQSTLEAIHAWMTKIRDAQTGAKGRGGAIAGEDIADLKSKYSGRELQNQLFALIDRYGNSVDAIKKETDALTARWGKTLNPFKSADLKKQLEANKDEISELTAVIEILKDALTDLSKVPPLETILSKDKGPGMIGGLTPAAGKRKISPEATAITSMWVKGQLGSNGLAAGPNYDAAKAEGQMAIEEMIATQNALDEMMDEIEYTLQSGKQMAIDLGAEFIGALGEAIGGGNMKDIGKNLLMAFANFLSTFGKMLITLGIGMKAFQESLKNLFANPLVPIAAGVALIATAGIIRGAAQKAASGVSGGGSGGGGGSYSSSSNLQNLKIQIEGKLKGKDIYWSTVRYVEENG